MSDLHTNTVTHNLSKILDKEPSHWIVSHRSYLQGTYVLDKIVLNGMFRMCQPQVVCPSVLPLTHIDTQFTSQVHLLGHLHNSCSLSVCQ